MVEKFDSYVISVIWGKSNNYVPYSNEPFDWSGSLTTTGGTVQYLDKIHYKFIMWVQAQEEIERIYDIRWHSILGIPNPLTWESSVKPGNPAGLEGIRFCINCEPDTEITINMKSAIISFSINELINREHLRFHAGGKYSGVPIEVFLGHDARKRVSRKMFLNEMRTKGKPGWLIMPDDFTSAPKHRAHSMYGMLLEPGAYVKAVFPIDQYREDMSGDCIFKIQAMAMLSDTDTSNFRWIILEAHLGKITKSIRYLFTTRANLPKLEDIYISFPWEAINSQDNELTLHNTDTQCSLLIHRVFIGTERPSHKEALRTLPSLPAEPTLWVGYCTNMITPENGDMDTLLDMMHEEELGNFIQFRERGAKGSEEDVSRWRSKLVKCSFLSTTCDAPSETEVLLNELGKTYYLGTHGHEWSNLIYGWGFPDPMEVRRKRTLAECQDAYLKRMSALKVTGNAIPLQHLDYMAGVEVVMTEIPAAHATLCLAGARGAAQAFDKSLWGVHVCNHVSRCPIDEDTVRRLFIVINQSWLFGAGIIYDEEVALRYNHDTVYAFSDPIPQAYRNLYQQLYHYGSAINLGKPIVKVGFLHGNFDCLVGGAQAMPFIKRTKVWGMFGPETEAWEFDTPERGWELLSTFMPGVWLYPVIQDPLKIRQFFSGTPHGQVDLVPITAGTEKLSNYQLLVLPGWNTMTPGIYNSLISYVQNGGHLVLCAAQCTEHDTRDFLLEKKDFRFYNGGDLSELAGIRVGKPEGIINTIRFEDDQIIFCCSGVQGLQTELCGAHVLAEDQSGRPVLVEHKLGQGRVWMLTVGEYWGHHALDELRHKIGAMFVNEHPAEVVLTGDSAEVDCHCYTYGNGLRVVLLNTDWTSTGNVKYVTLHKSGLNIPLGIREGRLTQVLIQDKFAVVFETLPAIVDDLQCDSIGVSFKVSAAYIAHISLHSSRSISKVTVDDVEHELCGNTLTIDFGPDWTTRFCRVFYN
jgi:hypothetical protein